jgi:putative aldouronate transport system permease protein
MIRKNESYYLFRVFNTLFLLFIVAITLLPFVNIVAKSFSDMKHISMNDVSLWPKGFTTETYKVIMGDSTFWANYKNTVIYTLLGTVISLFLTVLIAYPLSVGRLKGKNIILTFVVLTMFFNGGMIPNYVLVRSLGMRNTIWAIVVPGAVSTFYVLVMKTFFEGIPRELEEAAIVDGMDTYGILGKIILPLSKPIIATMVLFYAVGAWNNWFSAFLYLDHSDMYPVTIYLRNIIAGAMSQSGAGDSDTMSSISSNIKAVTIVLTSVPILSIYPFLQRYFVQGMMIGSVKG